MLDLGREKQFPYQKKKNKNCYLPRERGKLAGAVLRPRSPLQRRSGEAQGALTGVLGNDLFPD